MNGQCQFEFDIIVGIVSASIVSIKLFLVEGVLLYFSPYDYIAQLLNAHVLSFCS